MARADDVEHIEIVFLDEQVHVRVHKRQARTCSPVTKQTWLDIFKFEICFDVGIVLQKDHGRSDEVCSPSVFLESLVRLLGQGWLVQFDEKVGDMVRDVGGRWGRVGYVNDFAWHDGQSFRRLFTSWGLGKGIEKLWKQHEITTHSVPAQDEVHGECGGDVCCNEEGPVREKAYFLFFFHAAIASVSQIIGNATPPCPSTLKGRAPIAQSLAEFQEHPAAGSNRGQRRPDCAVSYLQTELREDITINVTASRAY